MAITFSKDVDTSNRTEMINFLKNHFRYHTAQPWNRSTSYAHNVKIHRLGIEDPDIEKKMYQLCSIDTPDLDVIIGECIQRFRNETGYDAGFNGRSSGYIVLYDANLPFRPIDENEDFDDEVEWPDKYLKEHVELIQRFDKLCDEILAEYIYFCKTHELKTITITRTFDVNIFVPIEPTEEN